MKLETGMIIEHQLTHQKFLVIGNAYNVTDGGYYVVYIEVTGSEIFRVRSLDDLSDFKVISSE